MDEHHDAVIVGGGQAGLAMSFHLGRHGIEHVILERHRLAERWRSERWASLMFQMPNWWISMPGMRFEAADPNAFASANDILNFLETYAARMQAPVRTGVEVKLLSPAGDDGLALETTAGAMTARSVVIATGAYHSAKIPDYAAAIPPEVHQVSAAQYRAPGALPVGAVLVVGSGASGSQIAEDLLRAGRRVYLSVGRHRAVPRRYRGRDVIWWLERLGRFDATVETLAGGPYPPRAVYTGAGGGHDLSPRLLEQAGVTVVGRILGFREGAFSLAKDVNAVLDDAEDGLFAFLDAADALAAGLADENFDPAPERPLPGRRVPEPEQLSLRDRDINTVVWATGYTNDFSWVRLPLFDGAGTPVQNRGVTGWPGVYFLGLFWMHSFGSSTLPYVGRDAEYLADRIAREMPLR